MKCYLLLMPFRNKLMNDYWKRYWDSHTEKIETLSPQRQVLRVSNNIEIEPQLFQKVINEIKNKMEFNKNDRVLDLCGGNGLIAEGISNVCKEVVVVDFSEKLINEVRKRNNENILCIVKYVTYINFNPNSFEKIILYAGIQYLDYSNVVALLKKCFKILTDNGKMFIGDIPDYKIIWNFYNNVEREAFYFDNVENNTPLIGTWFDRLWIEKLARYIGYSAVETFSQPKEFICSHFRFDALLRK